MNGVEYTPIKLGKLEVAQYDFPNRMKWKYAKKACADLGSGWRLPTKDELNLMYLYRYNLGDMMTEYECYWSSTENYNDSAWFQNFLNGNQYFDGKYYGFNVRAVRDIK